MVARELAVPVVVMHSRGPADSNKDYSAYDYAKQHAVLEGVMLELGEKVNAIVKGRGGLRRWLVMVDPGIGFSKSVEGNISLLRDASSLTAEHLLSSTRSRVVHSSTELNPLHGYPQLIGTSRKSFLGNILEEDDEWSGYRGRHTIPKDRDWATAGGVVCAVERGVAVVRVQRRHANGIWP